MNVRVSSLHVYPVKSCKGIDMGRAEVLDRGFKYDRAWVITAPDGIAITQREVPSLALVKTRINADGTLILSYPGKDDLLVSANKNAHQAKAVIWGDDCRACDQGDDAGAWISKITGRPSRLVTMDDSFKRLVDHEKVEGEISVGFADSHPFLLISQASLDELNSRLEAPVPMNRFRPNIVVAGCDAFAEDSWNKIRIGGITFGVTKPCARCVMVTIDQSSAALSKEPLKTLAEYRTVGKKVMFGQNVVHYDKGFVAVGDAVEILD